MLLPMVKVQVIGAKQVQQRTVRSLQGLGAMQIEEWREDRGLLQQRMALSDEAVRWREHVLYVITRTDAVLSTLPMLAGVLARANQEYPKHGNDSPEQLLRKIEADLGEIEPQVKALISTRDRLAEQLGSLPRYAATLRLLLPLAPSLPDLEHYGVIAVLVERRYQEALQVIREQLEEQTHGQCEVLSYPVDADTIAALLVFPNADTGAVSELLGRQNIAQVRLPAELEGQSFEQALSNIERELQEIPRQLDDLQTRFTGLASVWRPRLLVWQALLRDQLAQIDVCTNLGTTDYTFVIEGWMPEQRLAELAEVLAREVGDEVLLARLPVDAKQQEKAPVILSVCSRCRALGLWTRRR
jgi:V/A-type H+-transporting ATPase subunit I